MTDTALYYRGGRLVLSLQASLDGAYDDLVVSGLPGALPWVGTPLSWVLAVERGEVSSRGLRLAYVLRGAALLHRSSAADLPCPLCHTLSSAWGIICGMPAPLLLERCCGDSARTLPWCPAGCLSRGGRLPGFMPCQLVGPW